MPTDETSDPGDVAGIEVLVPSDSDNEGDAMPADLPEAVSNHLMTETVGNIQATNASSRNQSALSMGVLQAAQARNFDELGTVESRANSGVMATPVASPAVQTGG